MGNAVQRARADYEWLGALTDGVDDRRCADADSVSAAGFALDSVDARATYRKPGGTAQVSIFQNTQRDYSLRADYAIYTDRKELRFNQMRLRFDTTRVGVHAPGAVRWGQPGIEIEILELRNRSNGRVFVDGRLPTNGAADLRLAVANFEVGDLLGLLQSDVRRARAALAQHHGGRHHGRADRCAATAGVVGAMFRGTVVPDVRTTFDYADVRLTARADASVRRAAAG